MTPEMEPTDPDHLRVIDKGNAAAAPVTPVRTPSAPLPSGGTSSPIPDDASRATYSVSREDGFDFLSAEYGALYSVAAATAFQHGVWLHRLYRTLAPAQGAQAVVVTVRRDFDQELMLVLPLVRTGTAVRILTFADLGVADYNAVVASSSVLEELGGNPVVVAGIRSALGRFDVLRMDRLAGPTDTTRALLNGAHVRRHYYDTHVMTLAETPEAWRESLDQGFVRHLDRKYKRLRPKGERVLRQVTDIAEVAPLMQRMRAFRTARFAERRGVDLVQDDDAFAFYSAVVEDSVRDGLPGRLVVLEVAGEPVAIAFDLLEADRELFLLVGYDIERLRNYSLGLLIVDSLAKDAISRGTSFFDLTVGDESYKSDFSARRLPLHQLRLPRTLRGYVALLLNDIYRTARRVAKRVVLTWEARKKARKSAPASRQGSVTRRYPVPSG